MWAFRFAVLRCFMTPGVEDNSGSFLPKNSLTGVHTSFMKNCLIWDKSYYYTLAAERGLSAYKKFTKIPQ
jgi:hypothetical protein